MNKMLHAVVLVLFGGACWFVSLMLKLPLMVQAATARLSSVPREQAILPAFTRLCMAVGPFLMGIYMLLALTYCVYVFWVQKAEDRAPWYAFLAATTSALFLALLPTIVAIYLPLVHYLNLSAAPVR